MRAILSKMNATDSVQFETLMYRADQGLYEFGLNVKHDKPAGDPMRHFNLNNRHEIKDASHGTVATVLSGDWETFSELSRYGFQLTDMSGQVWTMRRAA
jgi:hypothetical protein